MAIVRHCITDAQRLQLAHAVIVNLAPDQYDQLMGLIHAKVRHEMMFGRLPEAPAFRVLPDIIEGNEIHLVAELTDLAGNMIAGPYSIHPFPVGV